MYYSIWLKNVWFFFEKLDLGGPSSRSKVKVKVTEDGPWVILLYKLDLKCVCQLESKLCDTMWFWRYLWRHFDVTWRHGDEINTDPQSVCKVLWFDMLPDIVWEKSKFHRKFDLDLSYEGQGQISSSRSHQGQMSKVNVTFEADLDMLSCEINTKALQELKPEFWQIMWYWRHIWHHCDVQWLLSKKIYTLVGHQHCNSLCMYMHMWLWGATT